MLLGDDDYLPRPVADLNIGHEPAASLRRIRRVGERDGALARFCDVLEGGYQLIIVADCLKRYLLLRHHPRSVRIALRLSRRRNDLQHCRHYANDNQYSKRTHLSILFHLCLLSILVKVLTVREFNFQNDFRNTSDFSKRIQLLSLNLLTPRW